MIKAIVTDIEGTTTSIRFVHEVLFPYSTAALPGFLQSHWKEERVQEAVEEVGRISEIFPLNPETVARVLQEWITEDRKVTPLKALQGMIWREGYVSGALKSQVYPDANEYLRRWHDRGMTLAVFSSGSVEAQKLLFRFSEYGDLARLFTFHFDTTTGPKKEKRAYEVIYEVIQEGIGEKSQSSPGARPSDILFLSDIAAELDAAADSGMLTCQVVREEDGTVPGTRHFIAREFGDIERHFFIDEPERGLT